MNSENIFFIEGNFTGKLEPRFPQVKQKNVLDVSNLTNQWLEFSEEKLYLDIQHSRHFSAQGISHLRGRLGLAEHVDCTHSTLQAVSGFGGTKSSNDNIKNCQKVDNLGFYSTLSSNREASSIYIIRDTDKFINIDEHQGVIELHFLDHHLFNEIEFFYDIQSESMKIIENQHSSSEEYLIFIKKYVASGLANKILFFDKYNYLLTPVLNSFDQSDQDLSSKYLKVKNFIYLTKTDLMDNKAILHEFFQKINSTQTLGILGLIVQLKENKVDIALKIISGDTDHIVLSLGKKELDFVYGGQGQDIYYLTLSDLEFTKTFRAMKTIHINNLSSDQIIDRLAVPVLRQELMLKKNANDLVIDFSLYPQLQLVIDQYFSGPHYQHILLVDRVGTEWIFTLQRNETVSLLRYYRNLFSQIKSPFIFQAAKNPVTRFAVQGVVEDCLYYKDTIGMTFECLQKDDLPVEISLFPFCQSGKNDLQFWMNQFGQLIDEESGLDFVDCHLILQQEKLAFNRVRALKNTVDNIVYYELNPYQRMILNTDPAENKFKKHLLISDAVAICHITRQRRQDLAFTFFDNTELLLGHLYIKNWNEYRNRISVIENMDIYIDGLEDWNLDDLSGMQTRINGELLQNYFRKRALAVLQQNQESFADLEALLLLLITSIVDKEAACSETATLNPSQIREELKLILNRDGLHKKAFIYLLLRICVVNDKFCAEKLEDIVSFLSLTSEDLLHLKSLVEYQSLRLKKITVHHYGALETRIHLAVSSGWKAMMTTLSSPQLRACQVAKEKPARHVLAAEIGKSEEAAQEIVPAISTGDLSAEVYSAQHRAEHSVSGLRQDETVLTPGWLDYSKDWLYQHRTALAAGGAVLGGGLATAWGFLKWRFAARHRRSYHPVAMASASTFFAAPTQAVAEPWLENTQNPVTCLTATPASYTTHTKQNALDFGRVHWDGQANLLFLNYLVRRLWTGKRDTSSLDCDMPTHRHQKILPELATNVEQALRTSQKNGWWVDANIDQDDEKSEVKSFSR